MTQSPAVTQSTGEEPVGAGQPLWEDGPPGESTSPTLPTWGRKGEGSQHDLILSTQGHCKVSIDSTLRMRQLRLGEVRLAAQGPTANQCRSGIQTEVNLSSTLSPPLPLTVG